MSSYHAERCVQARQLGSHHKEGGLEIHELGANGRGPVCNQKDRRAPTWQGYTMRWVTMGPGLVTCGNCAKRSQVS